MAIETTKDLDLLLLLPGKSQTPKPSLKAVALKLLKRDDDSGPPSWVAAEVAAMAPGIVQSVGFTQNRKLARYVKTELHEKTIE